MTDLHRIQTHARSILEGEGQEESPLLATLRSIASVKRGLQGIYEDYHDTNQRNYHEMVYWRQLAQSYQAAALSTIRKHQAGE